MPDIRHESLYRMEWVMFDILVVTYNNLCTKDLSEIVARKEDTVSWKIFLSSACQRLEDRGHNKSCNRTMVSFFTSKLISFQGF